jgi:hypothetical protein
MVSCPVIVVVMLESRVVRCVHCDEDVACQETIVSKRQSDLLKMGVNTPETC